MRRDAGDAGVVAGQRSRAAIAAQRASGMAAVTLDILNGEWRATTGQIDFVVNADHLVVAAGKADVGDVALTEEITSAERIGNRITVGVGRLERRAHAVVAGIDIADDDAVTAITDDAFKTAGEQCVL